MDWRQPLLDHARTLGRDVYESPLGVGIDFEDGCDSFWVLPGEVTSTVPVPAEGPGDVDALLAEYDRIGRVRERALHVIRHYLASQQVRVDRGRGGSWGIELPGGASTSLSVGAGMTAVARDTGDVYETVAACLKNLWGVKVPSRKRFERHLAAEGPPPGERSVSEPHEAATLIPQTIRAALGMMGLCGALDNDQAPTTPEALRKAAEPSGRIGRSLLRLGERLPGAKASVDLLKPRSLGIEFDDGHGSFDVDGNSRAMAKRIGDHGPEAAGDQLADEYVALNAGRSAVLRAVRRAAAARGWRKDEARLGIFAGHGPTFYLGRTYREVAFEPGGALTEALRGASPEAAVRKLFAGHPHFAEACVAALREPAVVGEKVELPEARLRPRDVPAAPPLLGLTARLVADVDRFADDTLRRFLHEDHTLWSYQDRNVYDPAVDTWATPADWVEVARRREKDAEGADGGWRHPMAILILLDAGDPSGDALARAYLGRAEPHHEVSSAEVEIAWRYRREFPEVARKWFLAEGFDDVPFARERAALGDPVALRKMQWESAGGAAGTAAGGIPAGAGVDVDSDIDVDVEEITPAEAERLAPEDRERVHAALLEWARTEHRVSPPRVEPLAVALRMGWRDVGEALGGSPYLLHGLLTRDRRKDGFDEPGLLMAKDFLLAWSRLAPSPFLARLVATGRATDLVGLAEEASRASAAGRPDVAKNLAMSFSAYRQWLKDVEPALAIAWKRCRAAGVGG